MSLQKSKDLSPGRKESSGARWEEMPADRGSRLGERAAGVVALLFPQ